MWLPSHMPGLSGAGRPITSRVPSTPSSTICTACCDGTTTILLPRNCARWKPRWPHRAWLHTEARRQPVLCVVEDLHWVDPSTLELLSLLIDQSAQARLCLVLTARPEFPPPWAMVAHLTALTLRRFAPDQVARVATHVAGAKALPPAVLQELVR